METALSNGQLQRQTLRLYGELVSRSEELAGKLIFAIGEHTVATGLAGAASIAGATSLLIDPDVAATKAVLRRGGVDFVVNTLDEALRVLKNEIRQHRPLSVALTADPVEVLAEILERGVLPDIQVETIPQPESGHKLTEGLHELQKQGMMRIRLDRSGDILAPSRHFQAWLKARNWHEAYFGVATTAALRSFDANLLSKLPSDSRTHWLQRISQYQRPVQGGERIVWLSAAEEADAIASR
jgi:hypothetical protein